MLQENKNEMKVKWRKRLIINGHGPCETYTSSGCDIRYSPIQQILFFFRKQLTTGCSFKHKILSKRVTNTKKNYLHQIKPQKPIFFKLNTTVHVKFYNKRNEKKKNRPQQPSLGPNILGSWILNRLTWETTKYY